MNILWYSILMVLVCYVATSFVMLDWDFREWNNQARIAVVFFPTMFVAISATSPFIG